MLCFCFLLLLLLLLSITAQRLSKAELIPKIKLEQENVLCLQISAAEKGEIKQLVESYVEEQMNQSKLCVYKDVLASGAEVCSKKRHQCPCSDPS